MTARRKTDRSFDLGDLIHDWGHGPLLDRRADPFPRAMTQRQLRLKNSKPSETASSPQAQSLHHSKRMTIPGVGPVLALTYRATVDVPARFRKSKAAGAADGVRKLPATCGAYVSGVPTLRRAQPFSLRRSEAQQEQRGVERHASSHVHRGPAVLHSPTELLAAILFPSPKDCSRCRAPRKIPLGRLSASEA